MKTAIDTIREYMQHKAGCYSLAIHPNGNSFRRPCSCGLDAAITALKSLEGRLTVDALANEIRSVDGNNSLGAGALAEALMPFLTKSANP